MHEQDYLEINKQLWNNKTPHHFTSDFYDVPGFIAGRSSLTEVELRLLGNIKGKSVLHLQCHFGMDTLSMARMGAKVTGVDLSDVAIERARELKKQLGLDATFFSTDVYSLPDVLDEQFDIVFTSYGTIGWLPDMDKWAGVVRKFLKPGGRFVFIEFHPVVWMFNDQFSDIAYSYFNIEPIVETLQGTYADRNAPIQLKEIGWNHNLGEVLTALLKKGLQLRVFEEYDYSPHNCFRDMVEIAPGKYQISGKEGKLPLVYALVAESDR